MKKSLLIAAGLVAFGISGTLTTKVNANDFDIKAGTPGDITFTGSGTAQFNNSLGTNNSFQVGSSTNLGVNANVSSTNGYGVAAVGDLQLAGSTQLQQVIGTSGTASERMDSQAHETAMSNMDSWQDTHGSKDTFTTGGYSDVDEWQNAYNTEYNDQYSTSKSNLETASSGNSSNGTISGSFKTVETGSAQSSGDSTKWREKATETATASYGSSWSEDSNNIGYDSSGLSEDEWQSGYDSSYNEAYANASAASNRYSDSTVNVTGIGSDANVFVEGGAGETTGSNFNVTIGVLTDADGAHLTASSTDTASGSAGASLATSSFANQSSSSTASGFLQAFGAKTN